MDIREVIMSSLDKYGGPQKQASGWRMVRCPFHGDSNPSLGVYVALDGKYPLGFFNCLGCSAKGTWNRFAKETGLPEIQEWEKSNSINSFELASNSAEDEAQLLGEAGLTLREVLKRMRCTEAQKWPSNLEWRGYNGKLLSKLNAYIVNDSYNESVAVLFPIEIAGKVRGGIKAIFNKINKSQSSFITMKGEWLKTYGLFPYNLTKKLIQQNKYNFVILVEGPRDALRLVQNGIPALAILGAKSFSDTKAMFISALCIDNVYVMPDGDAAGDMMWARLKTTLKSVRTKRISLPMRGKNNKLDPDNMPIIYLKRLVRMLKKDHDFDDRSVIEF